MPPTLWNIKRPHSVSAPVKSARTRAFVLAVLANRDCAPAKTVSRTRSRQKSHGQRSIGKAAGSGVGVPTHRDTPAAFEGAQACQH